MKLRIKLRFYSHPFCISYLKFLQLASYGKLIANLFLSRATVELAFSDSLCGQTRGGETVSEKTFPSSPSKA